MANATVDMKMARRDPSSRNTREGIVTRTKRGRPPQGCTMENKAKGDGV